MTTVDPIIVTAAVPKIPDALLEKVVEDFTKAATYFRKKMLARALYRAQGISTEVHEILTLLQNSDQVLDEIPDGDIKSYRWPLLGVDMVANVYKRGPNEFGIFRSGQDYSTIKFVPKAQVPKEFERMFGKPELELVDNAKKALVVYQKQHDSLPDFQVNATNKGVEFSYGRYQGIEPFKMLVRDDKPEDWHGGGYFSGAKRLMTVYVNSTLPVSDEVKRVKPLLHHELIHAYQFVTDPLPSSKDRGQTRNYDVRGTPSKYFDPNEWGKYHENRELEFYPNIVTEVGDFMKSMKPDPTEGEASINELIKTWTRGRNRFKQVRMESPAKWRKMMSAFTREVFRQLREGKTASIVVTSPAVGASAQAIVRGWTDNAEILDSDPRTASIVVTALPRHKEEGVNWPDTIGRIAPYVGQPGVFFSMTAIEKLGINPQSRYNTPLGIYAYPLDGDHFAALRDGTLPFAGDQPFIQVFRQPENGVVDVSGPYSQGDLERDLAKIREWYKSDDDLKRQKEMAKEELIQVLASLKASPKFTREYRLIQAQVDYAYAKLTQKARYPDPTRDWYETAHFQFQGLAEKAKSTLFRKGLELIVQALDTLKKSDTDNEIAAARQEAKIQTPFGQLWNVTRAMSGNPKQWNALLRRLGYNGVTDLEGTGLIHRAEPVQAVFLSMAGIQVIGSFNNRRSEEHRSRKALDKLEVAIKNATRKGDVQKIQELIKHYDRFAGELDVEGGEAVLETAMYRAYNDGIFDGLFRIRDQWPDLFDNIVAHAKRGLRDFAPKPGWGTVGHEEYEYAKEFLSRVDGSTKSAALVVTAAEVLSLRRNGYKTYEGVFNGHRVRIRAEDVIAHGSYPAGKRQKRETVWKVYLDGDEVDSKRSLKEARAAAIKHAKKKKKGPNEAETSAASSGPSSAYVGEDLVDTPFGNLTEAFWDAKESAAKAVSAPKKIFDEPVFEGPITILTIDDNEFLLGEDEDEAYDQLQADLFADVLETDALKELILLQDGDYESYDEAALAFLKAQPDFLEVLTRYQELEASGDEESADELYRLEGLVTSAKLELDEQVEARKAELEALAYQDAHEYDFVGKDELAELLESRGYDALRTKDGRLFLLSNDLEKEAGLVVTGTAPRRRADIRTLTLDFLEAAEEGEDETGEPIRWQECSTQDRAYGNCRNASDALAEYLARHGVPSRTVHLRGFKAWDGRFDTEDDSEDTVKPWNRAHSEYAGYSGSDLAHVVVEVEGIVIDLTARQFDRYAPFPLFQEAASYYEDWNERRVVQVYKPHKSRKANVVVHKTDGSTGSMRGDAVQPGDKVEVLDEEVAPSGTTAVVVTPGSPLVVRMPVVGPGPGEVAEEDVEVQPEAVAVIVSPEDRRA